MIPRHIASLVLLLVMLCSVGMTAASNPPLDSRVQATNGLSLAVDPVTAKSRLRYDAPDGTTWSVEFAGMTTSQRGRRLVMDISSGTMTLSSRSGAAPKTYAFGSLRLAFDGSAKTEMQVLKLTP